MANTDQSRSMFPDPKERTPAILIVEDEILIRLALSDYLQECGFKVFEAGNAAEAIEIIESNQTPIDLVFTDVHLPGDLSGFGLAQWVRLNRPGLPVTLTSGDQKKAETAEELCENEPFFGKPYDIAMVVTHFRSLINKGARG
jgi:DNA-binding NtrC family response regulator